MRMAHAEAHRRAAAGDSAPVRPPPRIRSVSLAPGPAATRPDFASLSIFPADKITQRGKAKADQSIGGVNISPTAKGLDITAEAENVYTSNEFPDGFRWVQTVTTNDPSNTPVGAPLLPAPTTYVDPLPNDDTKPFYWTDAEEAQNVAHFHDAPGRPAHPTGTIVWSAILSLAGVNGKNVTIFDSMTYGFSRASNGTVTLDGPGSQGDISSQLAALGTEFPTWTFK